MAELLGFNADVMCLQEVDARAFTSFFLPHLRAAGVCLRSCLQPREVLFARLDAFLAERLGLECRSTAEFNHLLGLLKYTCTASY